MVNPEILWAQSREKVFITLNIEGISEQNIKIDIDSVKFTGKNKEQEFDINIDLIKIIDPDESLGCKTKLCFIYLTKESSFWNKRQHKGITIYA